MQNTSQDKRTLDLADAKEKPQCGENPLINSSYYYNKSYAKRESTEVKLTCPIQSQNSPVNFCSETSALTKKSMLVESAINHPQNSSVFPSQLGLTRRSNSDQNNSVKLGQKREKNYCNFLQSTLKSTLVRLPKFSRFLYPKMGPKETEKILNKNAVKAGQQTLDQC